MQRLEVSGAVRLIYGSLGVKRLMTGDCLNNVKVILVIEQLNAQILVLY